MGRQGLTHPVWASGSPAYVLALVLWLCGAQAFTDTESMVCYTAPPPAPANASTVPQELFFYRLQLVFDSLPGVSAIEHKTTLRVNDTCGVELDSWYSIKLWIPGETFFVECEYVYESSPPQTPLPTFKLNSSHFNSKDGVSTVSGSFLFERFVAADSVLQLFCQAKLPNDLSGLINDFFVRMNITMKLLGCPHARYGAQCDQACNCAPGVECHPFNGQCVCPLGLQGETCDQARPILSRPGPATVFLPFGQSATLTCIGYGMVPSLSGWECNGTRLHIQTGTEAVLYSPRPYYVNTTIVAASANVNGVYKCAISDSNQSNKVSTATVEVIVIDIPQPFLEAPQNQTVLLGDRAVLRCSTKPEAGDQTWAWETGNQALLAQGTSAHSVQVEHLDGHQGGNQTASVLTVARARFEDVGMYQCIVGHRGANDSAVATAWLTVQSPGSPPSLSLQQGASYNASLRILQTREGAVLTLGCEVAEAYPAPSITWFVGGENRSGEATTLSRTSENGISYDVNSSLKLLPSWHDGGKRVACVSTVTNFQPIQSEEFLLDVLYVPKVTVTPSERTVQPGQSPEFVCRALANPRPPVSKYQWTLRGRDGKVIRHYQGRMVRIQKAKPHLNMATLTCNVSNDLGWNSSKAVIKVFKDVDPSPLDRHWSAIMITVLVILAALMVTVPVLVFRHRGRLHDHFFKHHSKPNLKGKDHDVFVAYKGRGEEEVFVHTQLVPKLVAWGCEVCIDYQNFLPGREIVENIMAAVASSRKTLLVLSPDFMASEWCYFEFMCAVAEGLQRQNASTIPLMFRDIRDGELCASMRTLLDTVSFIPWPGEPGLGPPAAAGATATATSEFWTLLHRALETEYNLGGIREDGADNSVITNNNEHTDGNDHIALI